MARKNNKKAKTSPKSNVVYKELPSLESETPEEMLEKLGGVAGHATSESLGLHKPPTMPGSPEKGLTSDPTSLGSHLNLPSAGHLKDVSPSGHEHGVGTKDTPSWEDRAQQDEVQAHNDELANNYSGAAKLWNEAGNIYQHHDENRDAQTDYTFSASDYQQIHDTTDQSAESNMAQGAHLLREHHDHEAAHAFASAGSDFAQAGHYQDGESAYNDAANSYTTAGDTLGAQAASDMSKGLSDFAANHHNQAAVLFESAGSDFAQAGHYNQAQSAYENASLAFSKADHPNQAQAASDMSKGMSDLASGVHYNEAAQDFQNAGSILNQDGHHNGSAVAYEYASQASSKADHPHQAEAYSDLSQAESALANGDPKAAAPLFNSAAQILEKEHPNQAAQAFDNAGQAFDQANEHTRAGQAYDNAGDLFNAHGHPGQAGYAFQNAGTAFNNGGHPDQAGEAFQNAGNAFETAMHNAQNAQDWPKFYEYQTLYQSNWTNAAASYNNAGARDAANKDYDAAGLAYDNAGTLLNQLKHPGQAGYAFQNAGTNYQAAGEPDRAGKAFQSAMNDFYTCATNPDNPYPEIQKYNNLAIACFQSATTNYTAAAIRDDNNKDYQAAAEAYLGIAAINVKFGGPNHAGAAYANAAQEYTKAGDTSDAKSAYAQAGHYYEQAAQFEKQEGAPKSEMAQSYANAGLNYNNAGEYHRAAEAYNNAAENIGNEKDAGSYYDNAGADFALSGHPAEAAQAYYNAGTNYNFSGDKALAEKAYHNSGKQDIAAAEKYGSDAAQAENYLNSAYDAFGTAASLSSDPKDFWKNAAVDFEIAKQSFDSHGESAGPGQLARHLADQCLANV